MPYIDCLLRPLPVITALAVLAGLPASTWAEDTVAQRTGDPDFLSVPEVPSLPDRTQVPDVPDLPPGASPPTDTGAVGDGQISSFPFLFQIGTIGSYTSYREPIVPLGPPGPDWTQRFDARIIGHPSLSDRVGLLANLRFRTRFALDEDYDFARDSNLDVQELALDLRATDWLNLEGGRINVRNGVATGFNPTDWFKVDSLVVADSFDVVDRREDRLGTLVVQGIWHGERGVLVTGYRPEISTSNDTWLSNKKVVGLSLDRTNDDTAFYAKLTPHFSNNVSLTLDAFYEPDQPGVGAEVSSAISNEIVAFAEWFAQHRYGFVDESQQSAPLPDDVAASLGAEGSRSVQHQVSVGATWSLPDSFVSNEDIALTAEYHYNEAGLSKSELDAWFKAGATADPRSLWAIRGLAARRQEPLSEHEFFFRAAWTDAIGDADLTAISFVALEDLSTLTQVGVEVPVFGNGNLEFTAYASTGSNDSVFGSQVAQLGFRASIVLSF